MIWIVRLQARQFNEGRGKGHKNLTKIPAGIISGFLIIWLLTVQRPSEVPLRPSLNSIIKLSILASVINNHHFGPTNRLCISIRVQQECLFYNKEPSVSSADLSTALQLPTSSVSFKLRNLFRNSLWKHYWHSLCGTSQRSHLYQPRETWAQDLGLSTEDDQQPSTIDLDHKCSVFAQHELFQRINTLWIITLTTDCLK